LIEIREYGLSAIVSKLKRAISRFKNVGTDELETLAEETIAAMQGTLPQGKMADSFEWEWSSKDKLVISNTAPYKDHFIWGTQGPYKGVPYGPLVAWALEHGLSEREGRSIAFSISKIGTMNWGSRHKPKVYPQYGDGKGFDFPKYAVEELMKDKIAAVGNKITVRVLHESGL